MFGWIELGALVIVLTALTPLLGGYMAAVFEGPSTGVRRVFGGLEELI